MFWNRSGLLSPKTDLHMLKSCCLVQEIDDDEYCGVLSMHDQLRDIAYRIVREEGSSATNCTRLLGKDAENALKDMVRSKADGLLLA